MWLKNNLYLRSEKRHLSMTVGTRRERWILTRHEKGLSGFNQRGFTEMSHQEV